jgi:hypothetical protein
VALVVVAGGRISLLLPLAALVLAVLTACGGGGSSGRVITLRQAVSALHSAGYPEVRVDSGSKAIAQLAAWGAIPQLKKRGIDVACNVVVFNWASGARITEHAAARVAAALRRRCR